LGPRRLLAAERQGMADPVVVVGSTPVVVGSLVGGSVLVVVASVVVVGAAVVVGAVVGGAAVIVGPVTGGWVLVTPKVENAWLLVVGPAVAGPAALVGLLTARGPVPEVGVEPVGVVVGARGPVGAVDTDLGAGWVGTVGRAKAGVRRSGEDWGGSRMAEATRAARTPLVSPTATSSSLQGHRDLGSCRGHEVGRRRGRDVGRCRGCDLDRCWGRDGRRCRGVGSAWCSVPVRRPVAGDRAHCLGALPGRIPLRRWPHSP
jgi:hypothetical protein